MPTKQEWRKIAKAFEQYANGAPQTLLTLHGLCYAAKQFTAPYDEVKALDRPDEGGLYAPTYEDSAESYWWPKTRKGAAHRAIFATLMAEVA
jgi:hypothetical protein